MQAARRRNFVIELEQLAARARTNENLAAITAETHNAVEACLADAETTELFPPGMNIE